MTNLRRSAAKRLMRGIATPGVTGEFCRFGLHRAGYEAYEVRSVEGKPSDRLPPVFPESKNEVAAPQPLGAAKEVLTEELSAVSPMVYRQIKGRPGSSIFRHKRSILLPHDMFSHLKHVRLEDQYETCLANGSHFVLVREATEKIDKGVCAFAQGDYNWYHWLAEVLPKVLLSQNLPSEFDQYPLLVPEAALEIPSFRHSLDLCRGSRDVVPLRKSQLYEFGELVYIPPQVSGPFNMKDGLWPEPRHYLHNIGVVQSLRETILRKLDISRNNDSPKRVFLARPTSARSYNQDEILAAAQERGFVPVRPEKLSFREQVQLMHNADYVAGPTGAAFSNTLFMRPESRCLIWALKEYSGACFFSNLAHAANVDMLYCFVESESPITNTHEAFLASYTLPVEVFHNHVDAMLQGSAQV